MIKSAFAVVLFLGGCAVVKGVEDDVPLEGKADGFRSPTDHGVWDGPSLERISEDEGFHAWSFEVEERADVFLKTMPPRGRRTEVDTVLYLYRAEGGRYIARNDDDGESLWSEIDTTLEPGEYRVLVKGYDASVEGAFRLDIAQYPAESEIEAVDGTVIELYETELESAGAVCILSVQADDEVIGLVERDPCEETRAWADRTDDELHVDARSLEAPDGDVEDELFGLDPLTYYWLTGSIE